MTDLMSKKMTHFPRESDRLDKKMYRDAEPDNKVEKNSR